MRMYFKVILIVLLGLRTTTAAAQFPILEVHNYTPSAPATEQKHTEKLQHPACLADEHESVQSSPHLRWPLYLPALTNRMQYAGAAWHIVNKQPPFAASALQQAYYRSLLYPSHFFR